MTSRSRIRACSRRGSCLPWGVGVLIDHSLPQPPDPRWPDFSRSVSRASLRSTRRLSAATRRPLTPVTSTSEAGVVALMHRRTFGPHITWTRCMRKATTGRARPSCSSRIAARRRYLTMRTPSLSALACRCSRRPISRSPAWAPSRVRRLLPEHQRRCGMGARHRTGGGPGNRIRVVRWSRGCRRGDVLRGELWARQCH